MDMYALTVRQPWAQAIAQFGKDVENRKTRPPVALLGQRIAIHAGKQWQKDDVLWPAMQKIQPHCLPFAEWAWNHRVLRPNKLLPPGAGRIIATARLVGWVAPGGLEATRWETENDGEGNISKGESLKSWWANEDWSSAIEDAEASPWLTGPVGWVLDDVVMLPEPVGKVCTWPIPDREAGDCDGPHTLIAGRVKMGGCGNCGGVGSEPIRGQLGCWKVAPDVAAQVQEQEQMARGRR